MTARQGSTLPPVAARWAALIAAHDWSATPLGPIAGWPQSLKTVIRIMLTSRYAMWMAWGGELTFFCNDAYRPTLGVKQAWALGACARDVWAEIWKDIGPRIQTVLDTGEATWDEALLLFLERSGYPEETYHTFSYSPLPDDDGRVAGMLCVVTEETERVIGERRLASLRELASELAGTNARAEVLAAIERRLGANLRDLPFTLTYLFEDDGSARLACATGIEPGHPAAPALIDGTAAAWPARELLARAAPLPQRDLEVRFGPLPTGAWDKPPRQAIVVPIARQGQERPAGFLVAGVNPYRQFDAGYAGFVDLLAGQIAAGLANASAYEEERRRAEALAEIDRAKTAFFSNVSHEFRTPLTLMLGPLEEVLAKPASGVVPDNRALVDTAHRNGLRLLKLVNSLLDFSRIEAGRVQASYQPTDLAAFTAELASSFRSAMDRAGLRLIVDCAPLPEPLHVDREMWEKVVLNLLSNAFKFTFEGEIAVVVGRSADGRAAALTVRDTGTGIPAAELPRLFERFHRVEGARGRTFEGSGIGLALVQELVKLHGGTIRVESVPDQGSSFTVTLPFGSGHLPADQLGSPPAATSTGVRAEAYVEEALRWLPNGDAGAVAADAPSRSAPDDLDVLGSSATRGERVLLADDNADMRGYVQRLLAAEGYRIEAVADGEAALAAARREAPDLVLADVMMPGVDGFELLSALRAEPGLRDVPVLLLSARAGEEARVEGLGEGADDYLTKPFSTRELLARIAGNLKLARIRRETARALEEEARSLETLNRVGTAVAAELDLARAVQVVTDAATELSGAAFGSFFYNVLDERGEWYTLYTLSGAPREAFARFPMPRNTAVFGPTFAGEGPVRSDDITKDPRYGQSAPYHGMPEGHLPVRSYLAVPVISRSGQVLGGLFFGHPEPSRFDARAERLVTGIAAQAATAIDNARLYQAAQAEIAERRQTEAALRESEGRFRTMADSAPVMIWVTDPDGACTYLGRPWYEFSGQTEATGLGFGWLDVVHPDDRERTRATFLAAHADRAPFRLEYRLRRADGVYRWALDAALPRFAEGGAFLGYVGSVLDITERKEVEDERERLVAALRDLTDTLELRVSERTGELAAANRELLAQIEERERIAAALRQAQKMETIGQLTGGVAHDFNNLLTIIMGNLETLQRQLERPAIDRARVQRSAGNATRGAQRAAALTQRLLAFSRRQPLEPAPIDVNKLVSTMSDLLRRTLGERIAIETVLGGGLWGTHADPNQLESAILNLALNARDAMPEGGKLTIETANTDLDESYALRQAEVAPGHYVVVAITDTGVGMSRAVIDQAFEPFFTTKDAGHGTGLGLSQVYGFVKQSGGHVSLYSEPGEGTTVKIYLPRRLADGDDQTAPADRAQSAPDQERSQTVLVVEDDDDVRAHSAEILEELGYRVLEAPNGPSALEILERQPDVALLFTDVGLPGGMNGRQLAEEACRRRPGLEVLFTTGYARNAIVHDGRLDPGVQLITKPFSFAGLAAKVRDLLDG